MTAIAGRIQPVNGMPPSLVAIEAEEAVLGAVLMGDPETLGLLLSEVPDAQHFTDPRHAALYRVLADLGAKGAPVTVETIRDASGRLRLDGYELVLLIDGLVDAVPTAANLPFHAAILRERAARRAAYAAFTQGAARALDLSVALSDTAAAAASALTAPPAMQAPVSLAALCNTALTRIEQEATGGFTAGIPVGLPKLDAITRGWQGGHLILIAARPSVGKTQMACFAARAACDADEPVLIVTAEMSREQIVRRLIAMHAAVDLLSLNQGYAYKASAPRLIAAAGEIARWPLTLDNTSHTPGMVRLAAQRMIREHGRLGLIVVDYVQLLGADGRSDNRNQEVGAVGRGLHRIALDLDVPVIALSQLSRDVEKSGGEKRGSGREPRLSDLRDSGELEQAADLVLFLHSVDESDEETNSRRIRAILAKNRHGRRGRADLELAANTGRWTEAEGSSWAQRV